MREGERETGGEWAGLGAHTVRVVALVTLFNL